MRFTILILITSASFAQSLSIGVTGGVPLNQTLDGRNPYPSGIFGQCAECAAGRTVPYLFGPKVEVRLNDRFHLSFEALYNRASYVHTSTSFFAPGQAISDGDKHIVDRWQFPVLLKYSLQSWHGLYPFVALGGSVQYNQDKTVSQITGFLNLPPLRSEVFFSQLPELNLATPSVGAGAVFAAGVTLGSGRLRPTVEYRFTRWIDHGIEAYPKGPGGAPRIGPATLKSSENESALLAGFTVEVRGNDRASSATSSRRGGLNRLSVAILGGVPLTDAFAIANSPSGVFLFGKCGKCESERTVPYVSGAQLEIRIKGPYSLSAGGLYSRADYNFTTSHFSASATSAVSDSKHAVNRWEFPLLLKFAAAARGPAQPFIGLGASVLHSRDATARAFSASSNISGVFFSNARDAADHSVVAGPTVALGATFGRSRIRPSLELRYTRWFDLAVARPEPSPTEGPVVASRQNQAQVLVGIQF